MMMKIKKSDSLTEFRRHAVWFMLHAGTVYLALLWSLAWLFPRSRADVSDVIQATGGGSLITGFAEHFQRRWQAITDPSDAATDMEFITVEPSETAGEDEDGENTAGEYTTPSDWYSLKASSLRVFCLAQMELCERHGGSVEEALNALQTAGGSGSLRSFEEKRLVLRLAFRAPFRASRQKWDAQAFANAAHACASFEDFRTAACGALRGGAPGMAVQWAKRSLEAWPNRGVGYGEIYHILMLAHAANGDADEVMRMLAGFQDVYQEWLFSETYLPAVKAVERRYPRAPLLAVIRGHQLALLRDDAGAVRAFRQALTARGLSPRVRLQVAQRLRQLLKEKPR